MKLIPTYTWTKGVEKMDRKAKTFFDLPWASGVILITCVIVAMLLANLPATKDYYTAFLETDISMNIQSPLHPDGTRTIDIAFPDNMTVAKFINDILMVFFFFTVGLEIKREIVCGELSSRKKAMLPVIAAAGGMLMPALIFALVNHGTMASSGWGIPTATDIAFAVGIMSILGNKVPLSLKVFLTALAIADDLGSILIVALFYGGKINFGLLSIALVVCLLVYLMNIMGEKRPAMYLIPAIVLWTLFYYSGIHATMSGVLMAFMIPMKPRYGKQYFIHKNKIYFERINQLEELDDNGEPFPNGPQRHHLRNISKVSNDAIGLSYRLEHSLDKWVNFLIMPIFALANAGVELSGLGDYNIMSWTPEMGSVGLGVFFGLLIGKPLGITLASFIAIKLKIGEMPDKSSWKMLFAVACLGGIGFTMSIFVDTLSFGHLDPMITSEFRSAGKIAVLLGSICSGILGSLLILAVNKHENRKKGVKVVVVSGDNAGETVAGCRCEEVRQTTEIHLTDDEASE